jgi:uncharacterized phage-associated protein
MKKSANLKNNCTFAESKCIFMPNAKQVAEFFLQLSEPEVGDILSNLKIQKLVYYAQGFHLAMYEIPLFDEQIVAWEHGPVVEALYHEFKVYGSNPIPQSENFDVSEFTSEQVELLKEIYEVYGQFSAWKLRNMTHSEQPWLATERNQVIDNALLTEYFKTQLN